MRYINLRYLLTYIVQGQGHRPQDQGQHLVASCQGQPPRPSLSKFNSRKFQEIYTKLHGTIEIAIVM